MYYATTQKTDRRDTQKAKKARMAEEQETLLRKKWKQIDDDQRQSKGKQAVEGSWDVTAEFGYWNEYYRERDKRQNRFDKLAALRDARHARTTGAKGLTEREIPELWEHGLGDFTPVGPPPQ